METSMAPAMPCKISNKSQNCGNGDFSNKVKSKLACNLEVNESTKAADGESLPNHEDRVAGKGDGTVLGRGNLLDGVALRTARRRK